MKTILPLLLLVACTTPAPLVQQPPVITETEPSPDGTRSLHLQGFFRDADTVFMQVYHDGDVLAEEVRLFTWALTLGEHPWYVVKFTDTMHRVKYLSVFELSDRTIEFVPPIEIDFDRTGNILLVKPSDGKPDFLQIDVGMSRKR